MNRKRRLEMAACASQTEQSNPTERVSALNALARLGKLANARYVFTANLLATLTEDVLDPVAKRIATAAAQQRLITAIREADFTPDNDPYGEHDFGSFMLNETKVLWKIDVYENDGSFSYGAEHPEDPVTSFRLVTFMLPQDY